MEHYLKGKPNNYIGLLLLGIPIMDQILNALVLLLTNTVIRRGMKNLVSRGSMNLQFFDPVIVAPLQSKWITRTSNRTQAIVNKTQVRAISAPSKTI
uniref:Uncharacterized protein n=1 Tax=Acrobeloides nanus TaxID=290746 RepID=A0A914C8D4_9BILA